MYQRKLKAVHMKKGLLFGLLLAGLSLTGCEFNQLAGDEQVDELMLVPKEKTIGQKPKMASNQKPSPYSCLISTLADDEAEYNYWNQSFWVHFPNQPLIKQKVKPFLKRSHFQANMPEKKPGVGPEKITSCV